MKILFLAPQPFFQERGTPIAVDLAVRVLEEEGHQVDLLTYPEGERRVFNSVRHLRTIKVPFVSNIPMGFSWKKLVYSTMMFFSALRLVVCRRYQVIHAVEEAAFIGLTLGWIFRVPYIYDMDSSLAGQLLDKKPALNSLSGILKWFEKAAIRRAEAVVAVCPALVSLARENGAAKTLLLTDISLLDRYVPGEDITRLDNVLPGKGPLFLYVGNLESYQGIELLLQGWAAAKKSDVQSRLVIIGGRKDHVAHFKNRCDELNIENSVALLGPRPVADLGAYLAQADVVVSPRTQGNNTPMKVYTYLDSQRPLLATAIESHTQVLNSDFTCLVEPTPQAMGEGIIRLATDPQYRNELAKAAKIQVTKHFSHEAFRQKLVSFYQDLKL